MQFTTAIAVAVLAYGVNSAATPDVEAWCRYVGQPCGKVKRAADAYAAALAGPDADAEAEAWCRYVGQPCGKAKRNATPEAEPWCRYVGQPCGKSKREAEAACFLPGGPCAKAKRDTNALAHAVADALPAAEAEAYYKTLALRDAHPEPAPLAGK